MLTVAEHLINAADYVAGNFRKELGAGGLIRVYIIVQQLGIVVRHFLEMGNNPAFIDRITMKAASQLVINSASCHFLEGCSKGLFKFHSCVRGRIFHVGTAALGRLAERCCAHPHILIN